MRILVLTHYFWPEVGAPQVIHADWARRWRDAGHEVTVLTCMPNYPDGKIPASYQGKLRMEEHHEGTRVLRTWVYATPNAGFGKRLLNHLSFTASAWTAWPKLDRFDVVFTEYPPLFTSFSGLLMGRLRHVPHVLNVGDLWVQAAIDMGYLDNPVARRIAMVAEQTALRRSARVVVTAAGVRDRLVREGLGDDQVVYVPNSVDTARFTHDAARRERVRAELGWRPGEVIALYHGTHGLAQGLTQAVDAAKRLEGTNIRFVFLGDGADKAAVVARAEAIGAKNTTFLPPRPFDQMPGLVDACDVGLVPLRAGVDLFKMTLPSKMFEFMSAERPVVLGVEGDARDILLAADAGFAHAPGDDAGLADAVRRLAADATLREKMGRSGREHAVARYSRDATAAAVLATFQSAIAEGPRR